ncbi:MAG: hemerythrin domain-containing protein [Acidobacteria bacterium]|nr:hemerythrin domain-containing protein [Acidobacteriota bacterium]MCB9397496.1 hemerythrin domain-containing protein [Acidobacteriota bacterium]
MNIEQLWPDHPIRVMMDEHQIILQNLAALEQSLTKLNEKPDPDLLNTLDSIASNLLAAEKHHQREEEALFPELEEMGLDGPCSMMCDEHITLRELKHQLKALVVQLISGAAVQDQMGRLIPDLVGRLREHIEREDTILYPESLEVLDDAAWERITAQCEQIGRCSFSR